MTCETRVTAWRFSTYEQPLAARRSGWRDAMTRVYLQARPPAADAEAGGSVLSMLSPIGLAFTLIEADAQEIAGRDADQRPTLWFACLLEGEAMLDDGRQEVRAGAGDIVFGRTGEPARLLFEGPFRLLTITVPRTALHHRLSGRMAPGVRRLQAAGAMSRVLSSVLRATADAMADMQEDNLPPVELPILEFLVEVLAAEDRSPTGGGARSAKLHRLRQRIETLLSDPDLSLRRLADVEGVSTRYVQLLFADASSSFSEYVRHRRLERCRLDLANPSFASASITSIASRWGFGGLANFGRAFRRQYGISPREHRRGATRMTFRRPYLERPLPLISKGPSDEPLG